MNEKLEVKLFKKYPKIFRQKDLPMNQTCMCWGIECGDGWYQLLDDLCGCIQSYIDHCRRSNNKGEIVSPAQVEAMQVKEKFGGLRFYCTNEDDTVDGMIHYAEYLAEHTCEQCGSRDQVSQTKGWIITLCKKCMEEYKKKRGIK